MTVVNPKSISGINSITTGSGSDNLLTIHTSDASNTERFRIDSTGTTKIVTGIVTTLTATGSAKVGTGVTISPDGDAFFTGVCTATTFKGDGSQLSNVTSTTINNNADNRLITGSGTANTLEGESELNYSKESATQHMLVLGGTDDTASAWSGTRQGFKAIGTQPLLYLVDSDNTSGDDAYVGHASGVLYIAKRGGKLAFQTAASGGSTTNRWTVESDGHMLPAANNTYDIGSSSYRVRNVYTADLHCSNKGSSNDVDGTWGDYTIQEGESDLFLINNRNGKKYKFNLTEVS